MEPQRRYKQTSYAHFRALGYTNQEIHWRGRNPVNGFDPVKRKVFPGVSEFDSTTWPANSSYAPNDKTRKHEIPAKFALNDKDIVDLCYVQRRFPPPSRLIAHEYLSVELERRAWEKYGGPAGLDVALERRAERQANRAAARRARRDHEQEDDIDDYYDGFPLAILNIYGHGLGGGLLGGGFGMPFPQFDHWPQYQHQQFPAPNVDAMPALVPKPRVEEIQAHELEDQLHEEPEIIERGGEIGGIQAPRTPPRTARFSQLPSPPPTAPVRRRTSKLAGYAGKTEDADVKPIPRTVSPNRPPPPSTSTSPSEPKKEMVATSSPTTSKIRDLTHKGRKDQRDLNKHSSASNIKEEKLEPVDINKLPSNSPGTSSGNPLKRKVSPPVDIDLTIGDDSDDCLVPISPARKRLKESAEVQVIDVIDISDD